MTLVSLRGRVCNNCHATGHTKIACRNPPCSNIDSCKIKDKHHEHKMKVNKLQREIKSLENQAAEEEANIKTLASAGERAKKTSFFGLMRPRLKAQNLLKYGSGKRIHLDRDLLILQRALNNKVPDWGESDDWKHPLIIDQFQNSQLHAMMIIVTLTCLFLYDVRLSFTRFTLCYRDHSLYIFGMKHYK